MKLQKLISKLEKHHKKKLDLSLGRTFNLLKKLGDPQDKLKNVITVVGTNAKASMCYSLKSILNQAGYKTNLYTSPHLLSYTERYVFEDNKINEDDLIELLTDVEKTLGDDNATLFEILTCAFLKHAENFRDNINIIEAGLFHQFDSTNVFKENLMTLIGVIHSDHFQWLENKSIEGVIYEKTAKLLNSNIFINKQVNNEIRDKIDKSLEKNTTAAICFNYIVERNDEDLEDINFSKNINTEILSSKDILENKNIDSISSFIFERKLAIELNIYDLENEYLKISYILQYQIFKAFHTLTYVDSPIYIKKESIDEIFKHRWDFFDFISDRLNIYFFKETFGKSEKLNIALHKRRKFISNILSKKLEIDLPSNLETFIKELFKIDDKILSGFDLKYKDNFLINGKYNKDEIDEIFNYFFNETEFVLHLGAHKTATTFIQNIISKNKYDLAQEGILFIDLDIFREYVKFSKSNHVEIKEFLLFASIPILFCKPKE